MDYYFLEYILEDASARITMPPHSSIDPADWRTGAVLTRSPATPVRFRILRGDGGALPPYVNDPIPLMSDALVAALRGAGAENFQVFDAIIEDADKGTVHEGYQAVNILGLVNCADDDAPDLSPYPVIDSARARDLAMFRVATDTARIAVHRRIKDRLEALPIGASLDFRAAKIAVQSQEDAVGE